MTYPWLSQSADGTWGVEMSTAETGAELDRRMVIAQELRAGHLVLPGRAESDLVEIAESLADVACRRFGYRNHRWRLRALIGARTYRLLHEALERR